MTPIFREAVTNCARDELRRVGDIEDKIMARKKLCREFALLEAGLPASICPHSRGLRRNWATINLVELPNKSTWSKSPERDPALITFHPAAYSRKTGCNARSDLDLLGPKTCQSATVSRFDAHGSCAFAFDSEAASSPDSTLGSGTLDDYRRLSKCLTDLERSEKRLMREVDSSEFEPSPSQANDLKRYKKARELLARLLVRHFDVPLLAAGLGGLNLQGIVPDVVDVPAGPIPAPQPLPSDDELERLHAYGNKVREMLSAIRQNGKRRAAERDRGMQKHVRKIRESLGEEETQDGSERNPVQKCAHPRCEGPTRESEVPSWGDDVVVVEAIHDHGSRLRCGYTPSDFIWEEDFKMASIIFSQGYRYKQDREGRRVNKL